MPLLSKTLKGDAQQFSYTRITLGKRFEPRRKPKNWHTSSSSRSALSAISGQGLLHFLATSSRPPYLA